MVVDDNPGDLRLAVDRLVGEGFEVRGCPGPQEALALLAKWTPDLVVMDLRMPGMDGYRLAKELPRLPGHQGLPVIATTAFEPDPARAASSGVGQTVSKPVLWASLAAAIRARVTEASP